MHCLVLHCLQRVNKEKHEKQALPTLSHSLICTHRCESFVGLFDFFSLRVRLVLTSRVIVEGLTPRRFAIVLALSLFKSPASITSRCSLVRCFLLGLDTVASLPPKESCVKYIRIEKNCPLFPADLTVYTQTEDSKKPCKTYCNTVAF